MTGAISKPRRYYTAGQVALAAVLGSILAAAWLMARTYAAAEDRRKVRVTIIAGIGLTTVLLVAACLLPADVPPNGLVIGIPVGLYYLARQYQGKLIADLKGKGCQQASWWAAAGVGLLALLLIFAIIVAIDLAWGLDD